MRLTLAIAAAAGIAVAAPAYADCASGPFLSAASIAGQLGGTTLTDNPGAPSYNEVMPSSMSGTFSEVGSGSPSNPESPNYGTVTLTTVAGSPTDFSTADKVQYAYRSGFTSPSLAVVRNGGAYLFCSGSGAVYTSSVASGGSPQ